MEKYPELVPMNTVRLYHDYYVDDVIKELKLNMWAVVLLAEAYLVQDADGYMEHMRRQLIHHVVDSMLAEGKFDFKTINNHTAYPGKELMAETIVMTKQELYKFLTKFGVQVEVTQKKL